MNSLADFIAYEGEAITGTHPVLVWSLATGYFFTQFNLVGEQMKVIARKERF